MKETMYPPTAKDASVHVEVHCPEEGMEKTSTVVAHEEVAFAIFAKKNYQSSQIAEIMRERGEEWFQTRARIDT